MLIRLTPGNTAKSYTASENEDSIVPGIMGDFAASLVLTNGDRTTGDEKYDVKIQESPDPDKVSDANATWYDLVTFTQIASTSGSEKKTVTSPHFGRLRLVVTLDGTTPSADIEVFIEGLRVGGVNRKS